MSIFKNKNTAGDIIARAKEKLKSKEKYIDLGPLLEIPASYYVIFGARSNGKTTSALMHMLREYTETGAKGVYLRRWAEDIRGSKGGSLFDGLVSFGYIEKVTGGKYNTVDYKNRTYRLTLRDADGNKLAEGDPFCYSLALTEFEHDKGRQFPDVKTIVYDEFITRGFQMNNEFALFQNTISTVFRRRDEDGLRVVMLANTVNTDSLYFSEMGISIKGMAPGDLHTYRYKSKDGGDGCTLVVYYADSPTVKSGTDKFFAFDNATNTMIKSGGWELAMYPHAPQKYRPADIVFTYFIYYGDDLLQCEIVQTDDAAFTYIHRKTTPLQDEGRDLVFSPYYDPRGNYRRNIARPFDAMGRAIWGYFQSDNVYYQDNPTGEIVRNYLIWCKNNYIIRS